MNTAAWVLLAAAGVVAVADWVAVWRRPSPVETVLKPLVLVLLIAVSLVIEPEHDVQRAWFVAALVLSLAGDVFLLPAVDRFVPGLASFLLGHVAYIVGFVVAGQGTDDIALMAAPLIGIVPIAFRVIRAVAGSERELLAPVVVYVAVIATMAVAAYWHRDAVGMAGALLFVASDSILALDRFDEHRRWMPLAVMVTYHLAQALLVLSLLP